MLNEALDNAICEAARPAPVEVISDGAPTDEDLAAAVVGGDDSAFETLFDRHKRGVTRLVGTIFRESCDVEEIVQQTFTKAYFSIAKFRGGDSSFKSWLMRIAINTSYDELRRRKRRPERLFAEMSVEESEYVECIRDGRAVRQDQSIVARQLADKLLSQLSPEDRVAVLMVYTEQCSLDDAASAIGISTSSLKSRLFRFRNTAKTRFAYLFR
jgi:RNA polymerase sigma-70 factor (ECF subfamily)